MREKEAILYTIIIPHKNEPVLLQRCLDSIPLKQDVEVVIVDDDSDEEIVDFNNFPGLNRKNTKVVFLKGIDSKGAGNARNIGLEKAKGKWILFCDADDYFTEFFYLTVKKYENSDYHIIIFNIDIPKGINYQGSTYQNIINNYDETKEESLQDVKFKIWTPWAKLYNKDFINRIGVKFESRRVGNDAFFVISANNNTDKIEIDKTKIYYHYYNNHGLSHKKKQSLDSFLDRMEIDIWRRNLYRQKKLYRYLDGAGIYQVLIEVYKVYGLKAFFKTFYKSFKYGANFTCPIKYKLKKILMPNG
ncbi:glycosyltransferase family 2 protein [Zunongwangia atlantica]|uniref:Glycosyl transferase 2 n=1 Tax=Zunongwangia atlantica 22II14-10F7 TaxID=1185767 RepID=A0A1Y1SY85_9FLAO|nr:glycosyltransferase [Zunongwangia atlantica]ORL43736.1 glycosyl transferase 2 [Zunongwangia atlantica 22II14-10F7]